MAEIQQINDDGFDLRVGGLRVAQAEGQEAYAFPQTSPSVNQVLAYDALAEQVIWANLAINVEGGFPTTSEEDYSIGLDGGSASGS